MSIIGRLAGPSVSTSIIVSTPMESAMEGNPLRELSGFPFSAMEGNPLSAMEIVGTGAGKTAMI